MFHHFIYYVNSSTEYFSNWLGHDPPPFPVLLLHVSLFAQRRQFGQLVWGGNYLLAATKLFLFLIYFMTLGTRKGGGGVPSASQNALLSMIDYPISN